MSKLVQELKDLKAEKDFFIGFDSDGCVFDSMEIKQKECFCPAFINNFDMQGAATAARETWEFVNLYSKTRGVNRFLAAIRAVELLAERKELKARGINVPSVAGLKAWTERETKLGEASLVPEVEKNPHPDLQRALSWSEDVTAAVKKIVRNLPPYPQVPGILKAAMPKADLMVVRMTERLVAELEDEGRAVLVGRAAPAVLGQECDAVHVKLRIRAMLREERIAAPTGIGNPWTRAWTRWLKETDQLDEHSPGSKLRGQRRRVHHHEERC